MDPSLQLIHMQMNHFFVRDPEIVKSQVTLGPQSLIETRYLYLWPLELPSPCSSCHPLSRMPKAGLKVEEIQAPQPLTTTTWVKIKAIKDAQGPLKLSTYSSGFHGSHGVQREAYPFSEHGRAGAELTHYPERALLGSKVLVCCLWEVMVLAAWSHGGKRLPRASSVLKPAWHTSLTKFSPCLSTISFMC